MTSSEKLKKYPELYRAEISCRIACEALNGENQALPDDYQIMDYAIYNIAAAIGEIAAAMIKQHEQTERAKQ
jgi:hypothetical protein